MAKSTSQNGGGQAAVTADSDVDVDVKERFSTLVRNSLIAASRSGNPVLAEVAEHFGADPAEMTAISEQTPWHLHINRQVAINHLMGQPGANGRELGVVIPTDEHWGRLTDLLLPPSFPMPAPRWGQVGEEQREAGYKKWLRVVTRGLFLLHDAEGPFAIWVTDWMIEVMAPTESRAAQILGTIRRLGQELSPYRGECISVAVIKNVLKPQFEERPTGIDADDVILPDGLLERIEEHVVGIAHRRDELLAAGRHLKRGLLLWGRPGTGKTHTIRYLASQLPDHTVLLLPGSRLENLHRMNELIELCTPGIVVLDDVDYIAEDRTLPSMGAAHNLFELLEALDGVAPDADLLFVLTTNRADTIEPAVAARPGRVDQVAEIPPPDAACRRRLLALYTKGVSLQISDAEVDDVIARTEGVTGSFFRELGRRSTLAATGGDERAADNRLVVTAKHLSGAIDEMLDPDNPLTQKMLGQDTKSKPIIGADMSTTVQPDQVVYSTPAAG